MNTAQLKEALDMMKRAVAMMDQALSLSASEEGTATSTGFVPGTG